MSLQEKTAVTFHLAEPVAITRPFFSYREMTTGPRALLDSALEDGRLGRSSFIGVDPFLIVVAKRIRKTEDRSDGRRTCRARFTITSPRDGTSVTKDVRDAFSELASLLESYRTNPAKFTGDPSPLRAGAIGYVGYDACRFIEDVPDACADDHETPDLAFLFFDAILAHDHATQRTSLSVLGRGPDLETAKANAERTRDAMRARIAEHERRAPTRGAPRPNEAAQVTATFDRDAYAALVDTVKDHIARGDVFEVCLTQRFEAPFVGDAWRLYEELRRVNPAPFASAIDLPGATILSSSPERFLRIDANRVIESRPIKGTRRRGASAEEDSALAEDLATSPKDRAEHTMIVDVVRNDLGRVCTFGSVRVPELRAVEHYATVHQLVSTISGDLCDDVSPMDAIRACFPGGSMTGAPKIEAMKMIDGLERTSRGVYAGAIGYVDFSGTMDLAIAIRTIVLREGRAVFGAGGAIVTDSDPRCEHEEALDKTRALVTALSRAGA